MKKGQIQPTLTNKKPTNLLAVVFLVSFLFPTATFGLLNKIELDKINDWVGESATISDQIMLAAKNLVANNPGLVLGETLATAEDNPNIEISEPNELNTPLTSENPGFVLGDAISNDLEQRVVALENKLNDPIFLASIKGEPGLQGPVGPAGSSATNASIPAIQYIYANTIAQPSTDPHNVTSVAAMNLSGETLVVKKADIGEWVILRGTLNVDGATTLGGSLTVSGATSFANGLDVSGTATLPTLNASTTNLDTLLVYHNATTTGSEYIGGDLTLAGSGAISGNLSVIGTINQSGGSFTGATTTVTGDFTVQDANASTLFFADNNNQRVGIATTTPRSSLHLATTDGLIIPVGDTSQRPSEPSYGTIRYNSETQQFEGYDGSNWGSLGGLIDVDQDTYAKAEDSPGADNDELKFYTANNLRLVVSATGAVGIATTTPHEGYGLAVATTTIITSTTTIGSNALVVRGGDGRVGIGTDSPGNNALKVVGSTYFSGNVYTSNQYYVVDGYAFVGRSSNAMLLSGYGGFDFQTYTDSAYSSKLKILQNGAVGIATTTPGGYYGEKLTVVGHTYLQGNATTTGSLYLSGGHLNLTDSSDNTTEINFIMTNSNYNQRMMVNSDGLYYFRGSSLLANFGSEGIKTTSSGGGPLIKSATSGTSTAVFIPYRGSSQTTGLGGTDASLSLLIHGDPRLFINADGNIGIGNVMPQYTLDVAGSLNLNSTSTAFLNGRLAVATSTPHEGYGMAIATTTIITSTTTIGNNALVVRGGDGNVGIGTASPEEKLEVVGNIQLDSSSYYFKTGYTRFGSQAIYTTSPGNYLHFYTRGASGYNLNQLFLNADTGNVGIGVSAPATKLEVMGNASTSLLTVGGTTLTSTTTNIYGGMIVDVDSNTLVVNANENRVGIGTANPNYALDVVGIVRSDSQYRVGNMVVSDTQVVTASSAGLTLQASQASAPVKILAGGSEWVRILSSGSIGIATTTPGGYYGEKLTVVGGTHLFGNATTSGSHYIGGDLRVLGSATYTGGSSFNSVTTTDSAYIGGKLTVVGTATSTIANSLAVDTDTLVVNANENRVGIGIVDPKFNLDVDSAIGVHGSVPSINFIDSNGTGNYGIGVSSAGILIFQTVNDIGTGLSARMTLGSSGNLQFDGTLSADGTGDSYVLGNLGIANTNPQYKLDVAGDININATSSIYMNSLRVFNASSTTYSLVAGTQAGNSLNNEGRYNVFMGYQAGYAATSSDYNIGIGYQSLQNTMYDGGNGGNYNTAIGYLTLNANTTGYSNVAIGSNALDSNTTGSWNFAMGGSTLSDNIDGQDNVGIGHSSLWKNTTGDANVGIGRNTILYNQTGSSNVAIGYRALYGVSGNSYNYNTAIGTQAGFAVTTGSNNVLIGYHAGDNITSGYGNLIVGYDIEAPSATDSNQMSIGNLIFGRNVDGTGTTLSSGSVGIATTTPYAKLSLVSDDYNLPKFMVASSTGFTTPALYVASNGNVGVGTASPSAQLEIKTDATSGYNNMIKIASPAAGVAGTDFTMSSSKGNLRIRQYNGTAGSGPLDGASFFGEGQPLLFITNTTKPIYFGTNNHYTTSNVDLTISETGNIGIATSSPAGLLDVGGRLVVQHDGNVGIATTTPYAKLSVVSDDYNLPKFMVASSTGFTTPALYVASNGNVGIGTNSPTEKLNVRGGLRLSDNGAGIARLIIDEEYSTGGEWSLQSGKSSVFDHTFLIRNIDNDLDTFAITKTGQVGIATTTPWKGMKLAVDGSVLVTGDIYKSSSAYVNPDYVFAQYFENPYDEAIPEDYSLLSLNELEDYVKDNSHLPGVSFNGGPISIFEANRLNLEKIEELSIYAIELNKRLGLIENGASVQNTSLEIPATPIEDIVVLNHPLTINYDLVVKGQTYFNADSVGQAKILAGTTTVEVIFADEYEYLPIVTISSYGSEILDKNINYTVATTTAKGFIIKISTTTESDLVFNWHAFASPEAKLFVSDGTSQTVSLEVPISNPPVGGQFPNNIQISNPNPETINPDIITPIEESVTDGVVAGDSTVSEEETTTEETPTEQPPTEELATEEEPSSEQPTPEETPAIEILEPVVGPSPVEMTVAEVPVEEVLPAEPPAETLSSAEPN